MITLAIILPVHNHLAFTKTCLHDLSGRLGFSQESTFHTVVIDDGSTDGTSEWVASNHPDVHLLKGDGNLWWSGAVNLGTRFAIETLNADYILLWNNDIQVEDHYFQKITEVIQQYSADTIIGSKVMVAGQPDLIWSMGGYFDPVTGKYGMHAFFEKNDRVFDKVVQVDWLTGMGTVIPRTIIEKLGYWDNVNFPLYHGDSDFTYRAKLNGYQVIVHSELKIFNSVENSGLEHSGSFRKLLKIMTDIRSKSNFKRNLKFYRLYAKSYRAFLYFYWKYVCIVGGFFKWKILGLFGLRKKRKNYG
jgi:GT2 family glycosyltransferase